MSLAIIHREPTDAPVEGTPIWRTCLREVAFFDEFDEEAAGVKDGMRLEEGNAYRLLLEILCGLQSPMLGETQVMGQFKSFLASLGRDQAWINRLGQRLLADAREVRTKHLRGLGSRSYGSAVRRDLEGCHLAVLIGTGKLAAEVLPFLTDNGRFVDQWGRAAVAPEGAPAGVIYRSLDGLERCPVSSIPAAIIIAAPVPSEVVEAVASRYATVCRIIDLRAEFGGTTLQVSAPVVTLQDLFARMRAAENFAASHVEAARMDIARRSRQYELRDELRPFGWDDLCA